MEHCKNEMEPYFINEYRTYKGFIDCKGYNMTLGGEGTPGSVIESSKNGIYLIHPIHTNNKWIWRGTITIASAEFNLDRSSLTKFINNKYNTKGETYKGWKVSKEKPSDYSEYPLENLSNLTNKELINLYDSVNTEVKKRLLKIN